LSARERPSGRKLRIHAPVFLGILGLVLLVAAVRLWGPFSVARRQRAELARLHAQAVALQAEHAQLEQYKRRLASDQGAEAVARQGGYLKPGDRRLLFVREKQEGAKAEEAKDPKNAPAQPKR